MGFLKNEQIEEAGKAAEGWKQVAMSKDYRCSICGNLPEYEDRSQYFETKLCADCLDRQSKDRD